VLARHRAPLHTATIVVEAKAYQSAVDKDRVMKLIQIVDDLGADRGILITTSHFTPDAVKTAAGHNVEIWDRERVAKLLGELEVAAVDSDTHYGSPVPSRAIAPRIDLEEVSAQLAREVEKRGRGVLGIGKVREELIEVRAIAYPYYDVEVEVHVTETQRVGLMRKETVSKTLTTFVSFDAHTGMLVVASSAGVQYPYAWLAPLNKDEIEVLRLVGSGTFGVAALATLGMSDGRGRKAISSLVARGVLRQTDERPAQYRAEHAFPPGVNELPSLGETFGVDEQSESRFSPYEGAMFEPAAIVRAVESYFRDTTIRTMSVVYYPYYCAIYRRADTSKRLEVIDGVSGDENVVLDDIVKISGA